MLCICNTSCVFHHNSDNLYHCMCNAQTKTWHPLHDQQQQPFPCLMTLWFSCHTQSSDSHFLLLLAVHRACHFLWMVVVLLCKHSVYVTAKFKHFIWIQYCTDTGIPISSVQIYCDSTWQLLFRLEEGCMADVSKLRLNYRTSESHPSLTFRAQGTARTI